METSNKMDLLVSFDTTGSMYPVLSQVRREVEQFVKDMFTEFTDLRLGIIAHGDYCDKDDPYTIRVMDFTRDEERLCDFVRSTAKTYGGDADECYELVLNTAYKELDWRDDADKIMIMIGDASPHSVNYNMNKGRLDWRKEADNLADLGVKVFSVHALAGYRSSSRAFYKTVAEKTLGVYLTLDQFNEIVDLIKATVCQQDGEEKLNEFVTIIRDNGRMTHSMENNIKRLRGEKVDDTYESYTKRTATRSEDDAVIKYMKRTHMVKTGTKSADDVVIKEMDKLVPVIPGRFQVMTVDENCDIKGFVTENGIEFKKGRGFYELTKAETVQQYKEIIMQDRETGEMFNGSQVRERLGLQPQTEKGGVNEKLYAKDAKEFRIFVQSTSVNRKLIAGTTFLYEITDMADVGTTVKEEDTIKKVKEELKEVKKELEETKKETAKAAKAPKKTEAKTKKTAATTEATETKAKKATKKVEKAPTETVFTDLEEKSVGKEIVVDTDKKKEAVKKSVKAVKTEKKSKDTKKVNKSKASSLLVSIDKIKDGLERCEKSENKKNITYLRNNLAKAIKAATEILNSIEAEEK